MPRTTNLEARLKKIISLAQKLLTEIEGASQSPRSTARRATSTGRRRRSGKELESFRKMLKAERKKGTPVADLAKQHGVTTAYIYQVG